MPRSRFRPYEREVSTINATCGRFRTFTRPSRVAHQYFRVAYDPRHGPKKHRDWDLSDASRSLPAGCSEVFFPFTLDDAIRHSVFILFKRAGIKMRHSESRQGFTLV